MKNNKFEIIKTIPRDINETWSWISESDKTEKWYGPFRVEGDVLYTTLIQEEGRPEVEGRILQCKSKELIELKLGTTEDSWIIKLVLNEVLDGTKVTLYQDKTGTKIDPWIEAGWVFYLDCLLAAVNKTVMPMFEDYAPEGDAPTYEG